MKLLKFDLNENGKPVVIEERFIRYDRLGEKIAYMLCLGYELTVELFDRFGNGQLLFSKKDEPEIVFTFKEIKVEDTVTIEYNKLGVIKRLYK